MMEQTHINSRQFVSPALLQGQPIPEREWIVPDWIPFHQTSAFYGDGGTGKSLVAMQLMTACALGKPWLGLPAAKVKTLGVFCEDTLGELQRRQNDINYAVGCDFSDLDDLLWYSGVGADNVFATFDATDQVRTSDFYASVEKTALEFGARLVIIDTAADVFAGSENQRGHVRQFIGKLTALALKIDGAVLLCAHPSVAGIASGSGFGGSTAWSNSVRSRLYLDRPKPEDGRAADPDLRVLTRKKSNYARLGDDLTLRWDNGVFVREDCNSFGSFIDVAAKERRAQAAFLMALRDFTEQGRILSSSSRAGNFAPKMAMVSPHCQGFTKRDLSAAMEALFLQGRIRDEAYGRGSNPSRKIIEIDSGNGCNASV